MTSHLRQAGQAAHASPDAAGAVQKELARFLKGCPGGVVVLDNAQKLHPSLLPVFINALSELGSFEVRRMPHLASFSAWICCDPCDGRQLARPPRHALLLESVYCESQVTNAEGHSSRVQW